jgi:hypothetical protein
MHDCAFLLFAFLHVLCTETMNYRGSWVNTRYFYGGTGVDFSYNVHALPCHFKVLAQFTSLPYSCLSSLRLLAHASSCHHSRHCMEYGNSLPCHFSALAQDACIVRPYQLPRLFCAPHNYRNYISTGITL